MRIRSTPKRRKLTRLGAEFLSSADSKTQGPPVGTFRQDRILLPEDPDLLAYTRTEETEALLSVANLCGDDRRFDLPAGFVNAEVLLSNCGQPQIVDGTVLMRPWESLVLLSR